MTVSTFELLQPQIDDAGGQTITLAAGVFLQNDTAHLGYGGTNAFTTRRLVGAGPCFWGDPGFGGTQFVHSLPDRPALVVQGGRQSGVKGLTLAGPNLQFLLGSINLLFGPDATLDASDRATWRGPALLAVPQSANRYCPYVGFAIDPYSGPRPSPSYADVNYPPGESTAQWGRALSSQTTIEDVNLYGFELGAGTDVSGGDGNGDFTEFVRVSFGFLPYAYSAGNSQGRTTRFDYCNFEVIHTILTTITHGLQLGARGFIFDACGFGAVVQLLAVGTAYAGAVTFNQCYGEQVWRIGEVGSYTLNNQPVVFNQCDWRFTDCGDELGIPATLVDGSADAGVVFNHGSLLLPGITVFSSQLEVNGTLVSNVWIDGKPKPTLAERKAQQCTQGLLTHPATLVAQAGGIRPRGAYYWEDIDRGGPLALPATKEFRPGGRARPFPWFYHPSSAVVDKRSSALALDFLDPGTGQGTIGWPPDEPIPPMAGDLIIDDDTLTVWLVTSTNPGGRSSVVPLNNLVKGQLRAPVRADLGNLYLLRSGVYTTTYPLLGDFTTGSPFITNVHRGDGFRAFMKDEVAIGDYLLQGIEFALDRQPAYADLGAYVRAVGWDTGTIAMSKPALRTGSQVPIGFFVRNDG